MVNNLLFGNELESDNLSATFSPAFVDFTKGAFSNWM